MSVLLRRSWYGGLVSPGDDMGLNPEPTRLDREWQLALATNVGRMGLEGGQMKAGLAKAVARPRDKASIHPSKAIQHAQQPAHAT